MNLIGRQTLDRLKELLVASPLAPAEKSARILSIERNVILPVKTLLTLTLLYYFFFSNWITQVASTREVAFETVRGMFVAYIAFNAIAGAVFLFMRRIPHHLIQWIVYAVGMTDAVLLSGLTLVTGGFDSILFWIFLGLIIRNAINIPLATPQIVLNLSVTLCYLFAGLIDVAISKVEEVEALHMKLPQATQVALDFGYASSPEPFILRLFVLLMLTACCYGVQALFEKQRQHEEEAGEFLLRQEQLQAAGRLAAEIAHQIKNPLGIISNAVFTLQRKLAENHNDSGAEQTRIIREEVERADRIITELMGYAQLAEGKVERLNVVEELDRALAEVFPAGASYQMAITRNYAPALPLLLMQRGHFSEIFVNILQNAREAMGGAGRIEVTARDGPNYSVVVTIADSGPGIPPDKIERIFEPYFTTKEKGTGLGLAIVRHNAELYGGCVRVESSLGKGSRFILQFPGRTLLKLAK